MDKDIPYIDEDLARVPEDIRRDLAEQGRNDLYFFAKGILGYKDMTMKCHGPTCAFLDNNPAQFKLLLKPRGHYKTSVATIARPLQKVCRNPEVRLLIANETATNAERFLSAIKQHCEGNKRFRALYSSVIPTDVKKVRWSSKELEFVRQGAYPEPTIDTVGMTGAWTSRHFDHMTFDDIISEEAAKSEKVMFDVINRISKLFSLMVNPEVGTFDLVGTRWAFWDVYSYMIKWLGPKMAKLIRAAIEDGEPIFPEKFSLETLAEIRNSPHMGEYMFSCQYMNNPRNPELQDFNINDLRFYRWSSSGEDIVLYNPEGEIRAIVPVDALDITVTVDPAAAERITSDRNGITVTGVTPEGDVIVLHAVGIRCSPVEVINHLIKLQERYSPRVFGIEAVTYQATLKYHLTAECERRGVYINVVDIPTPIIKKPARIRGLQPIVATGHMYIDPAMHMLRNEFSEFPLGEHDDVIDSLAMHQSLWRGLMSSQRWNKYKESEARLLARIDGYGLRPDSFDEDFDEVPTPKITEVFLP